MLPFGSITSIVPLFVLAFAYILYFGASSLNKNNADDNKVKAEKILYNQGVNEIVLMDFRNADDPGTGETIITQIFYPFPDLFISSLRLSPCRKTSSSHRNSCFSPRPPPIQI